jgi:hypothetical protein
LQTRSSTRFRKTSTVYENRTGNRAAVVEEADEVEWATHEVALVVDPTEVSAAFRKLRNQLIGLVFVL